MKQFSESKKEVSDLRTILSDHDLTYLTLNKPGLISNRINAGTKKIGKEIVEITTYDNEP